MLYTLIEKFNNQHSHMTFKGVFQGEDVTWNTHFFTLKGYNKNKNDIKLKQFIDISTNKSNTLNLTIALNIEEVNDSNIQKMMIMIKHYKNLSFGRHEYG